MGEFTEGQIESWYHGQILRIPHGKQNPTKKYLTTEQILVLFSGDKIFLQEKVDGRIRAEKVHSAQFNAFENMTGKQTVHKHVMSYTDVPADKKIYLDCIVIKNGKPYVSDTAVEYSKLNYAILTNCKGWNLEQIFSVLEAFSKLPSHFGSAEIEGIVVKNYEKQLFGKWVNEKFEDKLSK